LPTLQGITFPRNHLKEQKVSNMTRRSFQILVIPFCRNNNNPQYCIFKRSDESYWQGIAGGGQADESPIEAAKREVWEESGIFPSAKYFQLETISSIPGYY
jgi:dihydroneopterin triphosphate diphosphatase